jgi:hypothetical protein
MIALRLRVLYPLSYMAEAMAGVEPATNRSDVIVLAFVAKNEE